MEIIAHIYNGFTTKFGVPRQSGIVNDAVSKIIFEKKYRSPDAIRGLEEFSHIWVLWSFDRAIREDFSPTVRPPRLGGNKRVGVFATRSPFRPNSIGISALRLEKIEFDPVHGPVLTVLGADMKNATPIYDIKPYLPEFDSIPDARAGFAEATRTHSVQVDLPEKLAALLPGDMAHTVKSILAHDPKPSYRSDNRVYGLEYSGYEIKFTYGDIGITVVDIQKTEA